MTLRPHNLVPSSRRRSASVRARKRRWGGVLAGVAGAVALAQLAPGPVLAQAEVGVDERRAQAVASAERLAAESSEIRKRLAEVRRRAASAGELTDRPDWSIVLALLAARAPERLALTSCEVVGTTPGAHEVRFAGRAASQAEVSDFVLAVEGVGLFDRVELARSTRQEPSGEVVFEGVCTLAGSAKRRTAGAGGSGR